MQFVVRRGVLGALLMPVAFWAMTVPRPVAADDAPPPALARWLAPHEWQRDTLGPILSLGASGQWDDMHIFAPTVALEGGRYLMWYCGSRGTRLTRVFRLGLATSADGKQFDRYPQNPVFQFADGEHSVLTPCLLHDGDGNALREAGKLRMWFSSTAFGKTGLHALHETTSSDGIAWVAPSPPLLDHVYCPTVLKSDSGYTMWYVDVSKRPWVIRHATSGDGSKWSVTEQPVLQLSQPWEAEIMVYPCVLKVEGAYLMWYGSYYSAVRRQTTAIGFAASVDGISWHKHPQNPVLRPEPARTWESHYVTSGSVLRLPDGSYRYWYASRTRPPFENLYFAINTARWSGPAPDRAQAGPNAAAPTVLPLPPKKGDVGVLPLSSANGARSLDVLEIVDEDDAVVRAWYVPQENSGVDAKAAQSTFVDLWLHGVDTGGMTAGGTVELPQSFRATGNRSFDTTCGGRSIPAIEPAGAP
ncbi:MAG: hypothetical protein AB7O59_00295 [Pirellulales bacterium]